VTNTGFLTLKGGLVRDILYPKVFKYNFYNESLKFCAILGSFAIIGLCYTTPIMVENKTDDFTIIDRALNLFAIAVPPALPAAVGAGVAFASRRLRNQKIFCISPARINIAGRITHFVFDKTGTLTQEGLSVLGFRSASGKKFLNFETASKAYEPDANWWETADAKSIRSLP
jgi:P-type E1-E2 ATPase